MHLMSLGMSSLFYIAFVYTHTIHTLYEVCR